HPFGNPINGTIASVKKFDVATLQAHYKKIFHREAFIVVGAGDSSEGAISSWANSIELSTAPEALDSPLFNLPTPINPPRRQLLLVNKPDRTQTWMFAGQI